MALAWGLYARWAYLHLERLCAGGAIVRPWAVAWRLAQQVHGMAVAARGGFEEKGETSGSMRIDDARALLSCGGLRQWGEDRDVRGENCIHMQGG